MSEQFKQKTTNTRQEKGLIAKKIPLNIKQIASFTTAAIVMSNNAAVIAAGIQNSQNSVHAQTKETVSNLNPSQNLIAQYSDPNVINTNKIEQEQAMVNEYEQPLLPSNITNLINQLLAKYGYLNNLDKKRQITELILLMQQSARYQFCNAMFRKANGLQELDPNTPYYADPEAYKFLGNSAPKYLTLVQLFLIELSRIYRIMDNIRDPKMADIAQKAATEILRQNIHLCRQTREQNLNRFDRNNIPKRGEIRRILNEIPRTPKLPINNPIRIKEQE